MKDTVHIEAELLEAEAFTGAAMAMAGASGDELKEFESVSHALLKIDGEHKGFVEHAHGVFVLLERGRFA